MPDITITIPDDIYEVLELDMYEVKDWLQNDIDNKIRRLTDRLITQHTEFNPKKLSLSAKTAKIRDLHLETAKLKTIRLEQEMIR